MHSSGLEYLQNVRCVRTFNKNIITMSSNRRISQVAETVRMFEERKSSSSSETTSHFEESKHSPSEAGISVKGQRYSLDDTKTEQGNHSDSDCESVFTSSPLKKSPDGSTCLKSEEEYSNKNDCDRVHVYFLPDDENNNVRRDFERQTEESITRDASCLRRFRHNSVSSCANADRTEKQEERPSLSRFRLKSVSSYSNEERTEKQEDRSLLRKFKHNSVSLYSNVEGTAKREDKPSLIRFRHNSVSSYLKPDTSSKGNDSLSLTLSDWLFKTDKDNTTADEMSIETNDEILEDTIPLQLDEFEKQNNTPTKDYVNDSHNNTPTKDYMSEILHSGTQGDYTKNMSLLYDLDGSETSSTERISSDEDIADHSDRHRLLKVCLFQRISS